MHARARVLYSLQALLVGVSGGASSSRFVESLALTCAARRSLSSQVDLCLRDRCGTDLPLCHDWWGQGLCQGVSGHLCRRHDLRGDVRTCWLQL